MLDVETMARALCIEGILKAKQNVEKEKKTFLHVPGSLPGLAKAEDCISKCRVHLKSKSNANTSYFAISFIRNTHFKFF